MFVVCHQLLYKHAHTQNTQNEKREIKILFSLFTNYQSQAQYQFVI